MALPFRSPSEPLAISTPPFAAPPPLVVYATQLAALGTLSAVVAPTPFAVGRWPAAVVSEAPATSVTPPVAAVAPSLALALLPLQPPLPVQPTAAGRGPPAAVALRLVTVSARLLTSGLLPLFSSVLPLLLFAFVIVRFGQPKPHLCLRQLIHQRARGAFTLCHVGVVQPRIVALWRVSLPAP